MRKLPPRLPCRTTVPSTNTMRYATARDPGSSGDRVGRTLLSAAFEVVFRWHDVTGRKIREFGGSQRRRARAPTPHTRFATRSAGVSPAVPRASCPRRGDVHNIRRTGGTTKNLFAGMDLLRASCRPGSELHRPLPGFRRSSGSCWRNGRSRGFILRHGQQLLHDLCFFPLLGCFRLGYVFPRQDDTDCQGSHNRDP